MSKLCSVIGQVVFSNSDRGFALVAVPTVENGDETVTLFAHVSGLHEAILATPGADISIVPVNMRNASVPPIDALVEVLTIADPLPGKTHGRAMKWMSSTQACRVEAIADKRKASLAALAEKAAEEERKRQADMARARLMRGGQSKGGKKKAANA